MATALGGSAEIGRLLAPLFTAVSKDCVGITFDELNWNGSERYKNVFKLNELTKA